MMRAARGLVDERRVDRAQMRIRGDHRLVRRAARAHVDRLVRGQRVDARKRVHEIADAAHQRHEDTAARPARPRQRDAHELEVEAAAEDQPLERRPRRARSLRLRRRAVGHGAHSTR
jgi:hypothetical protein